MSDYRFPKPFAYDNSSVYAPNNRFNPNIEEEEEEKM